MQEIQLLLADTNVSRRAVLSGLYSALNSGLHREEVESMLVDMMRSGAQPGVISGAAQVLADSGMESEDIAALIADPDLSDYARMGFATAWAWEGAVIAGDVSSMLLPGLQNADSDVVHTILWFFLEHSRDVTMPAADVVDAVIPLLGHSESLIQTTAEDVLVALRQGHSGVSAQITKALRAAGLEEQGVPDRPLQDD